LDTRKIRTKKSSKLRAFVREMKINWAYYMMILPAAAAVFIVSYLPYPGIWVAFIDLHFVRGIWGSDFIGLDNFRFFFTSIHFFRTTFNTIWININSLFWLTVVSVTLSLIINELRAKRMARFYQNFIFFPFFLSAIIIGQLLTNLIFAHDAGVANRFLIAFGFERIPWLLRPDPWVPIVVVTNVWRRAGYTTIVYLATIAGIDETLYEAASIDGASRFQKIFYITLPLMIPAIITMILLSLGGVLSGDFGLILSIIDGRPMLFQNLDIIETFVFRAMRQQVNFGVSAAVGLYQSVVGFILVVGANWFSKRVDKSYGLF